MSFPTNSLDVTRSKLDVALDAAARHVERQATALAAELPEMLDAPSMQPVEMWFVWGILAELLDDDATGVQLAFGRYLHQRRGFPAERAEALAHAVRQACAECDALVAGMALGGRQAARGSASDRCFVTAALFLRYVGHLG